MSDIENDKLQKSINFDKHTIERCENNDTDHVLKLSTTARLAVKDFFLNWEECW